MTPTLETPKAEQVIAIVENIFGTVLDMKVAVTERQSQLFKESHFVSCVTISGQWNGAAMIRCPTRLAQVIAAKMFDTDEGKVQIADCRDALGEITNITAGNFKSLLQEATQLSLPIVSEGIDLDVHIPGAKHYSLLFFKVAGHIFEVTIIACQ